MIKSFSKRMIRYVSLLLSTIMITSLITTSIIWADTAPKPILTNGGSVVFLDRGTTIITAPIDVFIHTADDSDYYYTITGYSNTVDVFYDGEAGNPADSYFEGSLTDGYVKTLGENPGNVFGTLASDGKITVPKPTDLMPSELKVIAYKDGIASQVTTHTFVKGFRGILYSDSFALTVENTSSKKLDCKLMVEIYDEDYILVRTDRSDLSVPAHTAGSHVFPVNTSEYPIGKYTYKAFCFDLEYVPLFEAITAEDISDNRLEANPNFKTDNSSEANTGFKADNRSEANTDSQADSDLEADSELIKKDTEIKKNTEPSTELNAQTAESNVQNYDFPMENLALNKPVTVSDAELPSVGAQCAVDGLVSENPKSRWDSGTAAGEKWMLIDLEQQCTISRFEIVWVERTDFVFRIQTSIDGVVWTDAYISDGGPRTDSHTIPSPETYGSGMEPCITTVEIEEGIDSRYIRMTAIKHTGDYPNVSIYELRAFGYVDSVGKTEETLNMDPANIALGKTATASISPISYWGPDKLTDGIVNRNAVKPNQSRWSSGEISEESSQKDSPGWVQVDLVKPQTFDKLTLQWELPVVQDYQIQVSDDNSSWNTVYNAPVKAAGYPVNDNISLNVPVTARYVRLQINKLIPGAYSGPSLYEIMIWSPNVSSINKALGKNVTASKYVNSLTPDRAADGIVNRGATHDSQSRWSSGTPGNGDWLCIDLGTTLRFNRIGMSWPEGINVNFHIEISQNGSSWETVYIAGDRGYAPEEVIMLDSSVNARYIRIVADNIAAGDEFSMFEFGVYQDLDFRSLLDRVQDILNDTVIGPDDTELVIPLVPDGVELTYAGSDYEQVIDANGQIHKPIVDTKVTLEFKLCLKNKPDETVLSEITVTVPGRYASADSVNLKPRVLPELQQWFGYEGIFSITGESRILIDPALDNTYKDMANRFAEDYREITDKTINVIVGSHPAAGDFYFKASEELLGTETYDMAITDFITVSTSDAVGAFWSTRTILQILKQTGTSIPKGLIRDYPKYQVRGLNLDVSRKAVPMEFLKMWVKQMAWYKMNDFNLRLSDETLDSAYRSFRLESNAPNITNTYVYYTKDEFRSFIADSAAQGVNIVPEFFTLGHSGAYTDTKTDSAIPENSGYTDVQNPDAFQFIKDIVVEYMEEDNPVFPTDTVVHIRTGKYEGGSQSEEEPLDVYQDALHKFIRDDMGRTLRISGLQIKDSDVSGDIPRYMPGDVSTDMPGDTPVVPPDTVNDVQMYIRRLEYANPKQMYDLGYRLINIHDGNVGIMPGGDYSHDYLNKNNILTSWRPNNMMGLDLPSGDPQIIGGSYSLSNSMIGEQDIGVSDVEIFDRLFDILPTFSERLWSNCYDYNVAAIDSLTEAVKYAPGTNPTHEVESRDESVFAYQFEAGNETFDASLNGYSLKGLGVNTEYVSERNGAVLKLNGGESYVGTPLNNMRVNSTLDFWIKRSADSDNSPQVLFESDNGQIMAVQKDTGRFGFSRDFRDYSFNYTLPLDQWVRITLVTEYYRITLYVNGEKIHTLERTESGGNKWASLITPLSRIGSSTNAFKGFVDDVSLYNFAVTQANINMLPLNCVDAATHAVIRANSGVLPMDSDFVVQRLTDGTLYDVIDKLTDGGRLGKFAAYEIQMLSNGIPVQPNGNVTLTLPLPDGFRLPVSGDLPGLRLCEVSADGGQTFIDYSVEGNSVVWTTDHLNNQTAFVLLELSEYTPIISSISATDTLVSGYAANVIVRVEGSNLDGLKVRLFNKTVSLEDGLAKFSFASDKVPDIGGTYFAEIINAGILIDKYEITVAESCEEIWKPRFYEGSDGYVYVRFKTDIFSITDSFENSVIVNNSPVSAEKTDGDTLRINIMASELTDTDKIVVSGIKFRQFFPDYYFSFTSMVEDLPLNQ